MRQFYPDRNSLAFFRGVVFIIAAFLFSSILIFAESLKVIAISGIVIGTIAAVLIFLYFPLYFSALKYTATDSELIKRSGVFFKRYQSVHYSSIQYASVIKAPLSKYTGLNCMVLFVFGGNMELSYLKEEDISEIMRISGASAEGDM